jgi:hypothetical protein
MRRHYHAGTLMFAIAASLLTQAAACILRFGISQALSPFIGLGVMSQSPITGLGASTQLVRLSHSLESWQLLSASTVARYHLNLISLVFQGRATKPKPNCKFNVDADTSHRFGNALWAPVN